MSTTMLNPFEGLEEPSDTDTAPPVSVSATPVTGNYRNPADAKRVVFIEDPATCRVWLDRLRQTVSTASEPVLVAIDTETTAVRRILALYEKAQQDLAAVKARFDATPPKHPKHDEYKDELAAHRVTVNELAKEARKAGLAVGNGQVRLIQLYAGKEAVLVFDRWKITPADWRELCSDFLNTDRVRWVCHNAYFDVRMLAQHGAHPALPVECTLLQAHALNPLTTVRKTLSYRCLTVLGYQLVKELQNSDWSKPDLGYEQIRYAAGDVVATYDLFIAQTALLKVKADPRQDNETVYRLMADTIPAVTEIHVSGLAFDLEGHKALSAKLAAEDERGRAEALAALTACAEPGAPVVDNPGSNRQVSDWIKFHLNAPGTHGNPQWPRTATGQLAVGREDLLLNIDQIGLQYQEPLRKLAGWYKAKKNNTTLGGSFSRWVNKATGRIHANFRIGTETGRFSVTDPALQTINRGSDFRALFVAGQGRVLVACDYGTIELRVAAVVAGDEEMMRVIAEGADIHSMTAALAFSSREDVKEHFKATLAAHPELRGAPRIEWAKNKYFTNWFKHGPGKALRDAAKTTVFATLYGAGAANISAQLRAKGIDCDERQARRIQQAIFELFEKLGEWINHTRMEASGNRDFDVAGTGCVWTPAGRFYKPDNPKQLFTKSVNTPIQGGAAEIMLRALGLFSTRKWNGLDARLVHVVHDELIAEVRADQAEAARDHMVALMTEAAVAQFPNIPLTDLVDGGIGANWKEAKA